MAEEPEGIFQTVLEERLEDSREQEIPPLQEFNLTEKDHRRFLKFELLEFYGIGGGLKYFDVIH